MVTLMAVCEAAHALGDADAAREAYRLLEPFSDLPVMASLAIACFGSAHRPLGLAAWTMGDLDSAVRAPRAGREGRPGDGARSQPRHQPGPPG